MTIGELIRRRPVTIVVAVTSVVVIVGILVKGMEFVLDPLELPDHMASFWYSFNWALSVLAFFLIWRNLAIFETHWNWQELIFLRGVLLFVFGASLGYLARSFGDDPAITLGTPLATAGLMLLIYGSIRKPERFEDPNGSSR